MIDNKNFFDKLAKNYDQMIDFKKSIKNKSENIKKFVLLDYKNALDLGCGSGADSIALAKLGLAVDSVDQSSEMINAAKENAKNYNTNISFYNSSITDEKPFSDLRQYDIIVSLGNTLSNINGEELNELIKKLTDILANNGRMVFQIINYATLPKAGEYILNKKETEAISITRKYILNKDDIDFVIERKNKKDGNSSIIKTKLFPHTKNHFVKVAEVNNLQARFFGSLSMENYSEQRSKDLIVLLEN